MVRSTRLTRSAVGAAAAVIVATAAMVAAAYPSLPGLLPVHFKPNGAPNGWQFKSPARVLMPVFVQLALASTLGGIGALLLSRRDRQLPDDAPDVTTATAAAEAVALIGLIWISFQGYAAAALIGMWRTGQSGLGAGYVVLEVTGLLLTCAVGIRANARFGRPRPGRDIPEHWRLGQLYCNADNPALFVPTRDGSRWTLNFGRPTPVVLMGAILAAGVAVPTIILLLALRS